MPAKGRWNEMKTSIWSYYGRQGKHRTGPVGREAIKKRYKNRCVYCGRVKQKPTMEHLIPLSRGGHHVAENIVPACAHCNSRRRTKPILLEMLALCE